MLAFTEVKMQFANPRDRTIEGRFSITLPEGARLSRFSTKVNGHWQEGEVVEKQRARRAYEDFLHRKQDPALLEDTGTRTFTARVFPIPAKGTKELILSYSHVLTQRDAPYVFPLRGLPAISALDVEVRGGQTSVSMHKKNYVPSKDVQVPQRQGAREAIVAGRKGLVRVTPVQNASPSEMDSAYFLVDTSASRAAGFGGEVKMMKDLLDALENGAGNIPLRVDAFDQVVENLYRGKAVGAAKVVSIKLKQRRSLGATNLELA
ncbi:MAG: hypothetical protein GY822_13010 [Deltaproteobacteria bacterium]|nr:hypothetical protein [Deltaproteobacteria bacterium]